MAVEEREAVLKGEALFVSLSELGNDLCKQQCFEHTNVLRILLSIPNKQTKKAAIMMILDDHLDKIK